MTKPDFKNASHENEDHLPDRSGSGSSGAELFETAIEKIVTGGAGLGRYEGRAAFVPLTAPGDKVRARVLRSKKGFVEAELVEIVTPGPDRYEAECPHFGTCGGCDLQHLTGHAERQVKADIVAECFLRLGKMDVTGILTGPESAGPETGYRNKIRLFASPIGHYGLMRRGSHEVVPLETCLLMPKVFRAEILPWLRQLPPMERIVLRFDGRGSWLISLFGRTNRIRIMKQILNNLPEGEPPLAGCHGLLFNNLPLWGRDYLVMHVAGKKYRVGSQSFFQANLAETEACVQTTRSWLTTGREPGGLLVDLYCGVGLFALALADHFDRVIAIDADPHAVADARNNVARDANAREKVTVHEDRVPLYLAKFIARSKISAATTAETKTRPEAEEESSATLAAQWRDSCCIIDPPRAGLESRAAAALVKLSPHDILYLSCDPATLARDAALLTKAGYEAKRLQVFDFFPKTAHLESLLYLVRR